MLIQYIGKKPKCLDVVPNSGREWNGHGAVQAVPDAEKAIYAKHPDMFRDVTKLFDEHGKGPFAIANEAQQTELSPKPTAETALSDLEKAKTTIDDLKRKVARAEERAAAAEERAVKAESELAQVREKVAAGPKVEAESGEEAAIIAAIAKLNPDDPKQFKNGVPDARAVSKLVGNPVTKEAVAAAWEKLQTAGDAG